MVNINEKRCIEFGKDEKENRFVICIIDQEKIFLKKSFCDGGIQALADYILTEHFEKTETVKRLSCPWCPDDKTCFKSGKSLKFRGHFEDVHEFKCDKCGYICGISKVEGHLNTCRGTRLFKIITVLLVLTFDSK